MMNSWMKYAADFNALTDAEVEAERRSAQDLIDENESWTEAVASWIAAGRPRSDNKQNEGVDAPSTPHDTIDEVIREFNAKCENEGHHFAASSISPNTDYCQACGATRADISDAKDKRIADLEAELEKAEAWVNAALTVSPNIDLDIEAHARATLAELKGTDQ